LFGYELYWVDSLAALFIVFLLLKTSLRILRSTLGIFMEAAPIDLNFESVANCIIKVDGVSGLPDLHIARVGFGLTIVIAKVTIRDHALHDCIPGLIKDALRSNFPELGDFHQFIEVECLANPA